MPARTSRGVSHTEHTDPLRVRRGYKVRAYPARSPETRAARLPADHCDLYNTGLAERREARRMRDLGVCAAIALEGLNAAGMTRRPVPRPDGEGGFAANNAAAEAAIRPHCGPMDADVNGARNSYARTGLGSGQAAAAA